VGLREGALPYFQKIYDISALKLSVLMHFESYFNVAANKGG